MTWFLLPYAFVLTLAVHGPVVTGTLTGYAAEPCPVVGSVSGTTVGLVGACEVLRLYGAPVTMAVALRLQVDPATMGGIWHLGSAFGSLQPQH